MIFIRQDIHTMFFCSTMPLGTCNILHTKSVTILRHSRRDGNFISKLIYYASISLLEYAAYLRDIGVCVSDI